MPSKKPARKPKPSEKSLEQLIAEAHEVQRRTEKTVRQLRDLVARIAEERMKAEGEHRRE